MDILADSLSSIKPSCTGVVTQKAIALKEQGVDVLSLSVGEPDFDTPDHIVAAAKAALDHGMTRYTHIAGTAALRRQVAERSQEIRQVPCSVDQVIITPGAKYAIFEFFQAVLNPGDEVIIPKPHWVSYPDQVRLFGGIPILAETSPESGYVLTADEFERLRTPRTKVLVINSPNNPTGAVYSKQAIRDLALAATSSGVCVLCDEVYRDLVWTGREQTSPLTVVKSELRDRIFIVDGVSKNYAMTGWRIGWGIGHPDIIAGMMKIQGQSTTNPCAVAQAAALAALKAPMDFMPRWRKAYIKKRNVICAGLDSIPGVQCPVPDGAFYVLPSFKEAIMGLGENATDITMATYLLDEARVATVPGSAFGAPGHLRLSYATALETIESAVQRIRAAIEKLR